MTSLDPDAAWQLIPIPALSDNYIWVLQRNGHALVVDPGQAEPVLTHLRAHDLTLDAILLTHHHADHVGGAAQVQHHTGATVYGPASEVLPVCDHPVDQGSRFHLANLDISLSVLDLPGHTAGHVGYFSPVKGLAPLIFCGDTLFAAGCGRLFEGTAAQMVESLGKLAALPQDTLVCCGHEYTLSNLRWALQVEPGNPLLSSRWDQAQQARDRGQPTLPSTIGLEQQTNPFLRTAQATVRAAASRHAGQPLDTDTDVFACLRAWKNSC